MAYKVGVATGNWSTAGTWNSVTNTPTLHATTNITLVNNTNVQTVAFTAPNTSNKATGCLIHNVANGTGTGNITVTLQEFNGATWADTTATTSITITSQKVATTIAGVPVPANWVYFKFGTPYTFTTTTAGYYRFKIANSGCTVNPTYAADSGGANIAYLATDDRTGAPGSTDNVFIAGNNRTNDVTVTIDGNTTIGGGLSTEGATARSISCAIAICCDGTLGWNQTASATLTCTGNIDIGNNASWLDGIGTPLSNSYVHKVVMVEPVGNADYGIRAEVSSTWLTYGNIYTLWKTHWSSGLGTTGSPLVTADAVDWAVNDEIVICSNDGVLGHTINKFIKVKNSSTSYTLSDTAGGVESGLAGAYYDANGYIVNIQSNIIITADQATRGIYISNIQYVINANVSLNGSRIEYGTAPPAKVPAYTPSPSGWTESLSLSALNNVVFYKGTGGYSTQGTSQLARVALNRCIAFSVAGAGFQTSNAPYQRDFTDCFAFRCSTYGFSDYIVDSTYTRCVSWANVYGFGPNTFAILQQYNNCEAQGCSNYGLYGASTAYLLSNLNGFQLGNKSPNVFDIRVAGYATLVLDAPTVILAAVNREATNGAGLFAGQYLQLNNINNLGVYELYNYAGNFKTSSGALLVHSISTSLINTTNYNIASGAVTGVKLYFELALQILHAAYYAGVNTLPTMTVVADLGATSQAGVASATTSAQLVTALITPTTNGNLIVPTLSFKTDATTTNGDVKLTTLKWNSRSYGYTYTSGSYTLDRTTQAVIGSTATPVANPFITQPTQATVHAYTGLAFSANTLTISGNHTRQEVYDWVQDFLSLDANRGVASFFDTIDGVNYTATCNITINAGIALTGGGSINIGSNTWTNGGTYDGYVIETSQNLVHVTLNGLVAGSTVQLYNTTDSSELYNGGVAGTSLDYIFTYTADKTFRIRVRKAGQLPYEYSGTVGNTGLSLNVSQSADSIYTANAIDGSTVTEFSLSGSTVKIYVNDASNVTTGQRMYNWYMYAISTTTYIGLQPYDITAQTSWSYVLANTILIYNQKSSVLFISGANLNNVSANGQVIDTSGGPININGYFPFNAATDVGSAVWLSPVPGSSVSGEAGYDLSAIKAKTDALPEGIVANQLLANFSFIMYDMNGNPKTGLAVTAQRSIDGGGFASCANAVRELGSGFYLIDLAASDLNGSVISLRFSATNARDTAITIKTQT